MALQHTTAIRNSQAAVIAAAADAGTTNPNGQLVIMTSGDVEIATLELGNPAFGAPATGTITANAITRDESATGGVAALFKIIDRDGVEVYRGDCGVSGADMNIPTGLTITAAQPFEVPTLTYTAPV